MMDMSITARAHVASTCGTRRGAGRFSHALSRTTVPAYRQGSTCLDEHEGARAKYGAAGHTLYRDADKPDELTILM
jgi:hypothetical protein